MKVTVLLWGPIRVAAGASRLGLDVPDDATLEQALDLFFAAHEPLATHRSSARVAIGNGYAAMDRRLRPGDEISLIPPVQGG